MESENTEAAGETIDIDTDEPVVEVTGTDQADDIDVTSRARRGENTVEALEGNDDVSANFGIFSTNSVELGGGDDSLNVRTRGGNTNNFDGGPGDDVITGRTRGLDHEQHRWRSWG